MIPLLAAVLVAQVQVRDHARDWSRIRSENFDVHYEGEAMLPRARAFAGWFEQAREELVEKTGVAPRRVSVFLFRSIHDLFQANLLGQPRGGGDRPGRHRCRPNVASRALAFAEPLRDRIFIHCQPSDRWNAWFVRHELAHHVQFEKAFPWRLPSWLLALKGPHLPDWWVEGGADWMAGIFDARKDEYMRDLASEGLYDLKELFATDVINPYDGQAHYFQGSYFWRFLDEAYGREGTRDLVSDYSRAFVPLTNHRLRKILGRKRNELEREFEAHVHSRWQGLAGRTAPSERLTDSRAYYRRSAWGGRWSPDGSRLAWIGNDKVWPELYVDGAGLLGWTRGVFTGWLVSAPSWSPDGKRLAVIEWATNRDTLLLVDVDGGTETVEPEFGGAIFDELYDPAWAPDGKRIAFTALRHGTSDLYVIHLEDGRVERLTDDPAGDFQPAWSRDGRLAWIREESGRTVLHVHGKGPVTRTWALMEHPQWMPDGSSIVVAADVDGTYDAFAVDPETGAGRRLTRFRGGVSYPSPHPDGSLAVTYFQGRATDLYRVEAEPQEEPAFDQEERKVWYGQFAAPPPAGEPAEPSDPFGIDWLMGPVSSASLILPGLEFEVSDLDGENRLSMAAGTNFGNGWIGSATIANTRYWPTVGVTGSLASIGRLDERRAYAFVQLPLYPTLAVEGGWVGRYRREELELAPDPDVTDSGPSIGIVYDNRTSYRGWDRTWGIAAGANATWFDEDLGGDRNLREVSAFAEWSVDLVQDWAIWSRVAWTKADARALLPAELLDVRDVVRGVDEMEGTQRGVLSLEFRFPLWRDMLVQPLEFMGLGEFLVLKDLRGFAFGQAGYAGTEYHHAWDDDFGAVSAGLGLRLDFSSFPWPLVNSRVPMRLEGWWAIVGHDGKPARGEVGLGLSLGF